MSQTPFACVEGLRVGTVDYVSPSQIKVLLDIEAPESVALNAGGVRPFPRVNGYVLISVDDAFLVTQVEWLTIERSAFPKRRGVRDFGVVDLPYPLRKMSTNPVGNLRKKPGQEERYTFTRGADALPSVGGAVLLPTEIQLRAIVESGERKKVRIGTSPLAADAAVRIDPDRLFGRHLAVLGNTGSGKSCSVAGLIRWSLEAAREKRDKNSANARFIIIDPNGEYAKAFKDSGFRARVFGVKYPGDNNQDDSSRALKVPLWLWNSAEWISFTQASAKTQRPVLIQALRTVRAGYLEPQLSKHELLDADIPRRFSGGSLLRSVEAAAEMMSQSRYVEPLLIRIKSLLADKQIREIMDDCVNLSLEQWLAKYIGGGANADGEISGEISIFDLSLVPLEIIHIVTAVVARIAFEALQRYRKINGSVLPTVLVMEEAHNFIKRYKDEAEDKDASTVCCQVFERIAREGRKFGMGLVLSSQRPSELSPTVLSQCNTFLLHRISNDRDQKLVDRFVPDNLRGLLRELPTLPSQQAILLGWASELPVLTQIRDLPEHHRPQSEDPDFWDVWTGQDSKVDWSEVAQDWQGNLPASEGGGENRGDKSE